MHLLLACLRSACGGCAAALRLLLGLGHMSGSKLAGLQILELHQRCAEQARDEILQRQFKKTTLLGGCCGSPGVPSER
eukprot:COSAG05_NODE_1110_length_5859_cov_26.008507_8_plen_78_part_00